MIKYIFVTALSAFLFTATVTASPSSVTLMTSYTHDAAAAAVTTPAPNLPINYDLRKRAYPQYVFGYSDDGTISRLCNTYSDYATVTIYPNGEAYAYCSDPNKKLQLYATTAYNSWNINKACPGLAVCCFGNAPIVQTDYFIEGGYTVTQYDCFKRPLTQTFTDVNPAVLNPSGFSATLARFASSTSSTRSSTSSVLPAPNSSSPPPNPSSKGDDGSGGLSTGTKIGIGAGVGAGVGIVLIALLVFFCWRRHQKKKEWVPEVAADNQVQYYPQQSYEQKMQAPYREMQQQNDQHYEQMAPSTPWSPQPPYSPTGNAMAAEYPGHVSAGVVELYGQSVRPKA